MSFTSVLSAIGLTAFSVFVQSPTPVDNTVFGPLPQHIAEQRRGIPLTMQAVQTNRWWSLGIADDWPAQLFPWPLGAQINEAGVLVAVPEPKVIPTAVVSEFQHAFRVYPEKVKLSHAQVKDAGDWDVTFGIYDRFGNDVLDVTFAEGSPYAFFRSYVDTLSMVLPPESSVQPVPCTPYCGGAMLVRSPGAQFLVTTSADGTLDPSGGVLRVNFASTHDATVTIALIPDGADYRDLLLYANIPTVNTRADYVVLGNRVDTIYQYENKTAFGMFAHQSLALAEYMEPIGTYNTLRGPIDVYIGRGFRTSLDRPHLIPGLPLPQRLIDDYSFRTRLTNDVYGQGPLPAEVYASGKNVLRSAKLLEFASQFDDDLLQKEANAAVRSRIEEWCTYSGPEDKHYFAYDDTVGGIIAIPPAFGSDHYSDHHFHFGYFIHAASILARHDPSFVEDFGHCISQLVLDIASPIRDGTTYPYLRHFDVYAGHSWAHGITPFADGNNQESTSEAIQAWYAIALWGRAIGDEQLENLGTWLLAQEAAAARLYWFDAEPEMKILPDDFIHPMISILWGGKIDYATFFDASPMAIRGIQVFPATMALLNILDDTFVEDYIEPVLQGPSESIWRASLALVYALHDPDEAKKILSTSEHFDYLYTLTNMIAWTESLREYGRPVAALRTDCSGAVFERDGVRTAVLYRFPQGKKNCVFYDEHGIHSFTVFDVNKGWNVRKIDT